MRSLVVSVCSTNTLQRDKSAPLTSNEGVSVVAPIRMMLPFRQKGRESVLLRFVEAMDFIDKYDGTLAKAAVYLQPAA